MKDGMKTWLNPICVVTGVKCSTCSSLTHLSTDFPVMLRSQAKSSIQHAVLQKQTQAAWERGKKKKKAKDMIENYFRKRITLHYFSHQFWLVFISISSRLVETWPIPSLWDATRQFPDYSQIFPRLFEGRSPWTLPLIVQISHASPQASATRRRSWWHPTPVCI